MTKFTQEVERNIIEALKKRPMTRQELAKECGINYYSVLKAINNLYLMDAVTSNGVRARNGKIALRENAEAMYTLPTITQNGKKLPLSNLLAHVGNEEKTVAYAAVTLLPRYVARILNLAGAAEEGIGIANDLRRIKKEMQGDRAALKRMLGIYEEIIDNDSIWDASALEALKQHPDYDPQLIESAYKYYYPNG